MNYPMAIISARVGIVFEGIDFIHSTQQKLPIIRVYCISMFYGDTLKFFESLSVTNRQRNIASKRG